MKRHYPLAALLVLGLLFGACVPPTPQIIEKEVVVEKPVVQTVVIEKEVPVEKVVEKKVVETVIVEKEVVVEKKVVETVIVEQEKKVDVVVTATPKPSTALRPQYGGTAILSTGEGFTGPAGDFDGETTHDNRLMALYLDQLMIDKQDGSLEPSLATEISLADDELTWTVRLRPSARWHDGEPVVAEDLIYTINTICGGKTDPPALLRDLADVEGCQAYRDGEADSVSGITKIDDKTVQVESAKTNVALRYRLAALHPVPYHFWKDVPPDKLNQHPRWLDRPIGSGPFKMVKYTSDLTAEFEAFEDYYLGRPYLDKVIVRFAPPDTALAGLEAGEVDYVPTVNILDAERLKSDARMIIGAAVRTTTWTLFNHYYQEELRDPRVPSALAYAIDRDAINQVVFGGFAGPEVKMWYAPGTWPANPEVPTATYDPQKAKQLLEEAGFDFNTTMGLGILPSYAPMVPVGEIIQANFADIGLKLELYPIEESIITQEWWNKRDDLWFTMATLGGTNLGNPYATWPDLRTDGERNWGFYMCSFVDASARDGKTALEGCGNYIYGSDELDALMDQALLIGDQELAAPIMWQIDELLWKDPPGVPVINIVELHAWSSNLHDVKSGEEYDLRHWRHAEEWWLE